MKKYKKKQSKLSVLISLISITLLITAILSIAYPTISYMANDMTDMNTIKSYTTITNMLDPNEKKAYLREAQRYNNKIAQLDITDDSVEYDELGYENILNINNGIMGSVTIPSINVTLPIFHGTSEDALSEGAGHLSNTSFPIGGESTHAVISAHTAFPGKVFFDDLPDLKQGDMFYIGVLGDTLVYKVIEINIVDPNDLEKLKIIEGKDYVSLVTCYPYAVNTHRLIVTGERTYTDTSTADTTTIKDVGQVNNRYQLLYIILFILLLTIFIMFVISLIKRHKNKKILK